MFRIHFDFSPLLSSVLYSEVLIDRFLPLEILMTDHLEENVTGCVCHFYLTLQASKFDFFLPRILFYFTEVLIYWFLISDFDDWSLAGGKWDMVLVAGLEFWVLITFYHLSTLYCGSALTRSFLVVAPRWILWINIGLLWVFNWKFNIPRDRPSSSRALSNCLGNPGSTAVDKDVFTFHFSCPWCLTENSCETKGLLLFLCCQDEELFWTK